MVLEDITKNRDITEYGHFVTCLGHFVLEQSADSECIATANQNIGFQRARVDNRAGNRCTREHKGGISNFVANLGLHFHGDEVVLVDARRNDEGVAKLLILESAEDS